MVQSSTALFLQQICDPFASERGVLRHDWSIAGVHHLCSAEVGVHLRAKQTERQWMLGLAAPTRKNMKHTQSSQFQRIHPPKAWGAHLFCWKNNLGKTRGPGWNIFG